MNLGGVSMFLHQLQDSEKKVFLELAHLVAGANGIISEQEKQMIQVYNREMSIEIQLEDISARPLAEIAGELRSDLSRKASFVEVIAIAFADGVYDEEEKHLIREIREAFGFSESYYEEVKMWLKEFNIVYQRGVSLVS
jgi:tellurite resistance protein